MGSPPNYFILLLLGFWLEKWKIKVVAYSNKTLQKALIDFSQNYKLYIR